MIENLPVELRVEATKVYSAFPETDAAVLLIEKGVELHPDSGMEFEGPIPEHPKGICGLVPTEAALRIVELHGSPDLRVSAGALVEAKAPGAMFVVVVTANGVECGTVPIWVPMPADPLAAGGPAFGEFLIRMNRNDEFKLLRESIERAKRNPVKPGKYFQRIVAKEDLPNGQTVERIKLFAVDIRKGQIVITESTSGRLYARSNMRVNSIG